METSYELALPTVFPYTVAGSGGQVEAWVDCLLDVDDDSVTRVDPVLAVTCDFRSDVLNGSNGHVRPVWRLWLSDTSYARLRDRFGDEVTRNVDRRNLTEEQRTRTASGSARVHW